MSTFSGKSLALLCWCVVHVLFMFCAIKITLSAVGLRVDQERMYGPFLATKYRFCGIIWCSSYSVRKTSSIECSVNRIRLMTVLQLRSSVEETNCWRLAAPKMYWGQIMPVTVWIWLSSHWAHYCILVPLTTLFLVFAAVRCSHLVRHSTFAHSFKT